MSEDSVPTGRFLARVEFLKPDMPTRFARLRPIYQVDDQAWCPVEDGDSRFHDEGLVFWWVPPSMVANDTLWVVTLAPAPNYGFDHRHKDRWQVAEASRPYQAMTLYGVNGPRAFRRTLASGRLSFEAPVIGLPLIRVAEESGHWISLPESFKASKQNGRTLLTVTGLEGVIAVYSVNAGSFEQVVVDGHQYLLLLDPSIPIGYQCVASDAQLIEHLRKRISSLDRKVLDGLGVTKKLLRHYVDAIEAAGLGDDEAAKEEARRDAATALIEGLDAEVAHLDDIVGLLMENPRIAEDLNAKSEVELQRRREQWESELAQEYQAAVDSLTAKKREIETATQELGALRASITTAVEDILEAPLDALVRHGFLDGLRRSLHIEAVHSPPATPSSSSAGALETITKVDRLKEAAVAWSYGAGVDPYVMQVALAAVLSHRVTLISGANAERLAIALASTFAGDRAVRVSVGTAVFGVADLMNAPASPVGSTCFDRAPTLGDFLAEQTLENTVAVILSGCNRAPPEVVLPEFLLPLGGVSAVLGWSRAATQISTVELSPRVRIIGTLHQGDATYRVPPELSRQLGFIPADRRELEGIPMLAHPVPLPSRITPEIWDLLQSPGEDADVVTLVSWLRERGVGLPPDELMHVLTTYLHLLGDTQRALAEAIAGLLLGRDPVPDLAGLPGTNGESVRQRLSDLSNATAWQEAAHYFKLEEER